MALPPRTALMAQVRDGIGMHASASLSRDNLIQCLEPTWTRNFCNHFFQITLCADYWHTEARTGNKVLRKRS